VADGLNVRYWVVRELMPIHLGPFLREGPCREKLV
jgi:hypothetical protein